MNAMPTPPKPFTVLKSEKKSHRTKAELKQRQEEEAALSTGVALKERSEVRKNKIAHKEFKRINDLLKGIEKNDAIYEPVINRYCMLQAECFDLEERREEFHSLIKEIRETFKDLTADMNVEERAGLLIELSSELAKITNAMNNIDKLIQTKRKMLLDIEKENIMTIAAALRNIPKKEESKSNALLEALKG
jgi:hypothetical protein